VMGAQATAASDLYSLGIVAYECLAGAPPFTGLALAVALAHHERPLPPLPGQVPAEVAALVLELTAKDPAARPHSAGQVASRAGERAGRLRAGTSVGAGVPPGDPAVTVAGQPARHAAAPEPVTGQTARYPAAAPEPVTGQPTRRLAAAPWPAHRGGAGPAWRRRTGRAALPAAVGLLVVVAAFLIGSVIEPGRAPHAGTVPSAAPSSPAPPGAPRSRMVDVHIGAPLRPPGRAAAPPRHR